MDPQEPAESRERTSTAGVLGKTRHAGATVEKAKILVADQSKAFGENPQPSTRPTISLLGVAENSLRSQRRPCNQRGHQEKRTCRLVPSPGNQLASGAAGRMGPRFSQLGDGQGGPFWNLRHRMQRWIRGGRVVTRDGRIRGLVDLQVVDSGGPTALCGQTPTADSMRQRRPERLSRVELEMGVAKTRQPTSIGNHRSALSAWRIEMELD